MVRFRRRGVWKDFPIFLSSSIFCQLQCKLFVYLQAYVTQSFELWDKPLQENILTKRGQLLCIFHCNADFLCNSICTKNLCLAA